MTCTLTIDPAAVAAFRLDKVAPLTAWHDNRQYFLDPPGREHYRLFGYIASQLPAGTKVADLGTYTGFSALALSAAEHVQVTSYDIVDCIGDANGTSLPSVKDRANVQLVLRNCLDCMEDILTCPVIVCDVDPHDGIQERKLFDLLQASDYRGMVMCDDIKLNKGMSDFWQSVTQPKRDLSHVGHWSGTGVVFFGDAFTML